MMDTQDIFSGLIIIICLITSAFFSSSETAITGISYLKAKQLYEKKQNKSHGLYLWLIYPNRVLITILVFNNIVNILATAVATRWATIYFQDQAIGIVTGLLTLLILVFGEIIPKSYAKAHSEKLGLLTLRVIYALYILFFPLMWILSKFSTLIIKKLSTEPGVKTSVTQEDLEYLISVGQEAGVIEKAKEEMISSIFESSDTKIREIMTPRTDICAISSEATAKDVVDLVIRTGHSRIPVYNKHIDYIIGIILAKDLLKHQCRIRNNAEDTIKSLIRKTIFFPESKKMMDVFKELKETKNHLAIIVDEHGGTAGIVTLENILEEIVGDIQDEYDSEEAEILEINPETFDVAGAINIDEFFKHFSIDKDKIPNFEYTEDIDTLSGLLTQLHGALPKTGQKFSIGPLNLELLDIDRHRIHRIRVTKKTTDKFS